MVIILSIVAIFIIILFLRWISLKKESFQGSQEMLKNDFSDNYIKWTKWIHAFCPVWQNMVKQSLQTEQNNISENEYISQMEGQYYQDSNGNIQKIQANTQQKHITLYKCVNDAYTSAIPSSYSDLSKLKTNLPHDTLIFKTTLDFMLFQINTSRQKVQDSLNGVATDSSDTIEGFYFNDIVGTCKSADFSGNVICNISTSPTYDTTDIMNKLNIKLQTLNSDIPDMMKKLNDVQSGIQELNKTKQSAEDGTLVNQINLPNLS